MTTLDEDDAYPEADWNGVPEEYLFLRDAAEKYIKRPLDNDRIVELLDSWSTEEIQSLAALARRASPQEFVNGFNRWFGNLSQRNLAAQKLYALLSALDDTVPDSPFFRGH